MPTTQLSSAEWRVMNILWRVDRSTTEPIERTTARQVVDALPVENRWAYTTVKTMLDRLVEKGVLAATKRGVQTEYSPLLGRREAQIAAAKGLVARAFSGSGSPLVHHLLDEEMLTEEERQELAARLVEQRPSKGSDRAKKARAKRAASVTKPRRKQPKGRGAE